MPLNWNILKDKLQKADYKPRKGDWENMSSMLEKHPAFGPAPKGGGLNWFMGALVTVAVVGTVYFMWPSQENNSEVKVSTPINTVEKVEGEEIKEYNSLQNDIAGESGDEFQEEGSKAGAEKEIKGNALNVNSGNETKLTQTNGKSKIGVQEEVSDRSSKETKGVVQNYNSSSIFTTDDNVVLALTENENQNDADRNEAENESESLLEATSLNDSENADLLLANNQVDESPTDESENSLQTNNVQDFDSDPTINNTLSTEASTTQNNKLENEDEDAKNIVQSNEEPEVLNESDNEKAEEDFNPKKFGFNWASVQAYGLHNWSADGYTGWGYGLETTFKKGRWGISVGANTTLTEKAVKENFVKESIRIDTNISYDYFTSTGYWLRSLWVIDTFNQGHYEVDTMWFSYNDSTKITYVDTLVTNVSGTRNYSRLISSYNVPLTLNYEYYAGRLVLGADAGANFNFSVFEYLDAEGRFLQERKNNIQLLIRPNIGWQISQHLQIFAGGQAFVPIYGERRNWYGLRFGAKYIF